MLIETVFSFGGCWFFREAMSGRGAHDRVRGTALCRKRAYNRCGFAHGCAQIEIFGAISLGRLVAVLIVMTCTLRCGIMTGCTIGTAFGIAMDLTYRRNAVLHNGLCLCRAAVGHVQPPRETAVFTIVYHSKCSCGRMCVGVQAGDRRACSRCSRHLSYSCCCPQDFKPGRLHGAAGHRRQRGIRACADTLRAR